MRWIDRSLLVSPQSFPKRRKTGYVPRVESLEDRCLLSAGYAQTNLISDIPGLANFTDPNLVNPWGISRGPQGPFWLSNAASGTSTLNDGSGASYAELPSVAIGGSGATGLIPGRPTGTVFNAGSGFVISQNGKSGPSYFLFATEDGTITGWNPDVALASTPVAVDNSATPGHGPVYTGLAIAEAGQDSRLFAANFRSGRVDVFDEQFRAVRPDGGFSEPDLPAGFAPFNVQEIGGALYVAYTKQDTGRYDSGTGAGNGFVDVFDTDGRFLRRAASQGPLDVPWGIAVAPSNFGEFSNDLLVGNFGDGRINAFDPQTGAFRGTLTDSAGQPVVIPQLWGLTFGNDDDAGTSDTLYFAAGIGDERHGLFGQFQPASVEARGVAQPSIRDALAHAPASAVAFDDDDYPIPPAGGPALSAEPAPVAKGSVLLPSNGFPAAMVATLLTGTGGQSAAAPADAMAVSGNLGTGQTAVAPPPAVAGAGPASGAVPAGTGDNAPPAEWSVLDATYSLSAGAATPVVDAAQGDDTGDAVGAAVSPAAGGGAANIEKESGEGARVAERGERVRLGAGHIAFPPRGESVEAPESAAAAPADGVATPPQQHHRHSAWLRTAADIVFVALAGYGVQFTWSRRRQSAAGAVAKLRSVWSRPTRRPNTTVGSAPANVPSNGVVATQAISVRALDAPVS